MPLSQGQILNNRYRIVKLLGQGGFGAVYKAWDTNLEGPVALKESFETSPAAQKQFQLEAKLLFRLSHPNLTRVHDYFVIPEQGMYLVMDYIEGEDLEMMLQRAGGPLPEAKVLPWLMQVCEALEYLHSQNPPIIHRDIKPANIRLTPQGKAMLVDFGIAKLYDPNMRTTMGARAVTIGYSPPEQYGRGVTDAQSDVYALGATAYHLLTGFQPTESVAILSGSTAPLRPAHEVNAAVSTQVSAALERAMQLNQATRWGSMAEFRAALSPSPLAPPPGIERGWQATAVVQPAMPLAQTVLLELETPAPASRRLNWVWMGLGGLGVAVVVLGLIIWGLATRRSSDSKGVPMVFIPAGEFQMGSNNGEDDEKPAHSVSLDAFYIDLYEVTNTRYAECVSAGACQQPVERNSFTRSSYYGDSQFFDYPMIHVTWAMAKTYCEWRGGSLPSEAQWEKAARGGLQGMDYPWGNEKPVCQTGAQNGTNFDGCGSNKDTKAVGSFSPNGYGLFDMAGNVWEWVNDWYQLDYYASSPANNPTGPGSGDYKVLRGGSWNDVTLNLRSAFRSCDPSDFGGCDPSNFGDSHIGFRCVAPPGN